MPRSDLPPFDMPRFDMAVIGAGSAGLSVTYAAARLGLRVALIERDRMGGDCLNVGCVPSKALLACAHVARSARRAARYGVRLPEPGIDWAGVRAHVRGAIARIAPMDSVERYEALGATVLRGEARFVAPDRLVVDGRALTARRIVIAAGSRATVPPIPGLSSVPFLTNATLFDLPEKPEHLLILGGGAIGLEMAQAHAALGCRVTVLEGGRIAGREDAALADELRTVLRQDGVTILEGVEVRAVEAGSVEAGGVEAGAAGGGGAPTLVLADGRRVSGSHLLVAVGRTPNLDGLGLDAVGIRFTARGVATDRGLRSLSHRHVYAAGDIADPEGLGPRQLTHVAAYHAGIVVRRALFRLPARLDYAALPRVTYTDPELAQVGLTAAEARAAGEEPRVLSWSLAENDRAIAEGRTEGRATLVVGRRGRLLGAGILAPHAGEMIGLYTQAIGRRVPLSALAGMIVPYPTLAEAGKRAAGSLYTERLFSDRTRRVVRLLGRLP